MCLCLSVHPKKKKNTSYHVSTMVMSLEELMWYTQYNLHSMSVKKESVVCSDTQTGPAPSLSRHPVTAGVHSAHVLGAATIGPLFLYWATSGAKGCGQS